MERVGVLALQGSFAEHLARLAQLPDVLPAAVKTAADLEQVDRLILPGGESTAISKLLHSTGLFERLQQKAAEGLTVWGTCAGLILLAKNIVGGQPHLGVMDITVRRNAYGGQLDSFSCRQTLPVFGAEELPLVFIRAPWIESVGTRAEILAEHAGRIIAAREGKLLATSFHPELADSDAVYRYFLQI